MENNPEPRVTLEDLLRFKRSERPAQEFWTEFEAKLRRKQLAAAVAKRPWWFGLSQAFVALSRYQLSAGLAAVLAVTFLTVREYRESGFEAVLLSSELAVAASVSAAPAVKDGEASLVVEELSVRPVDAVFANREAATAPVRPAEREEQGDVQVGSLMSWGVAGAAVPQSPAARSIRVNLAVSDVGVAGWESAVNLGRDEVLGLSQSSRAEPLAQVASPKEVRRQRLFGYVAQSAALQGDAAERTLPGRDRLASRLSDQELYESVRRMSAGGDRLTLKF